MAYNQNIPLATDDLNKSQTDLLNNFQTLNSAFGQEHTPYSVATDEGLHKKVTTITIGSVPATTTYPIFYAIAPSANAGVLQFSKGPSDAIPTPLTRLHSTSAAISIGGGASLNVFDFTGMNVSYAVLYAILATAGAAGGSAMAKFVNGVDARILADNFFASGPIKAQFSGNILQIKNNSGGAVTVYWSLEFIRIQ